MFYNDFIKKNKINIKYKINVLISQHFPKKMQSRRQYKVSKHPWITPDILTAIKHKNKLYSKYLKSKSPELYC